MPCHPTAAHPWGPDALAALLRLRHLTSLCLASSCSKDSDIVALADSSLAGQLAELSVRNCFSISNASLARLAALPALTSLDLSGCWRVNAHGLRLLAAAGRLQELRLGFCEQVGCAGGLQQGGWVLWWRSVHGYVTARWSGVHVTGRGVYQVVGLRMQRGMELGQGLWAGQWLLL
jgi:hypothetical protein